MAQYDRSGQARYDIYLRKVIEAIDPNLANQLIAPSTGGNGQGDQGDFGRHCKDCIGTGCQCTAKFQFSTSFASPSAIRPRDRGDPRSGRSGKAPTGRRICRSDQSICSGSRISTATTTQCPDGSIGRSPWQRARLEYGGVKEKNNMHGKGKCGMKGGRKSAPKKMVKKAGYGKGRKAKKSK